LLKSRSICFTPLASLDVSHRRVGVPDRVNRQRRRVQNAGHAVRERLDSLCVEIFVDEDLGELSNVL
jgi:hypothetical protein